MNQIHISGTNWSPITGHVLPVCIPHYEAPCELFRDNLYLTERIGSESADAIVFGLDIDGCKMAVKLLFNINDKSFGNNENEISIANIVSNAVRKQLTDRFLVVYGATQCNNIEIDDTLSNLTLIQNARKYAISQYLRSTYGKAGRLLYHRNKNLPIDEFILNIEQQYELPYIPVSGHILISEMVWGDLIQLLERLPNDQVDSYFDSIIPEIFLAIHDLHVLGISHNDLHLGNLMLRLDTNGKYRVVIHDFGHSEIVRESEWTTDLILSDIGKLSDGIRAGYKFTNTRVKYKMAIIMDILEERQITTDIYLQLADLWKTLN